MKQKLVLTGSVDGGADIVIATVAGAITFVPASHTFVLQMKTKLITCLKMLVLTENGLRGPVYA